MWQFLLIPLLNAAVLVQPNDMQDIEFQRYLIEHPGTHSISEHLAYPPNSRAQEITTEMKLAQFEFLKGSIEKSKQHFRAIAKLRYQYSWRIKERKIIHYALLRLAQLEKEEVKKQFKTLQKQFKHNIWALPQNSGQFGSLLVNGRKVPMNSGFIRLPKGSYLFRFLSNRLEPYEVYTSTSELKALKLISRSLSQKGCINEEYKNIKDIQVLGQHCQPQFDARAEQLSETPSSVTIKDLEAQNEPKFYQSKWFWIGLSVLATGLAYNEFNRKEPNKIIRRRVAQPALQKTR